MYTYALIMGSSRPYPAASMQPPAQPTCIVQVQVGSKLALLPSDIMPVRALQVHNHIYLP